MGRFALLCILLAIAGPSAAAEIVGTATAIDADTIEIGGRRFDLFGIDAPEKDQVCLTRKKAEPWDCGIAAQIRLMRLLDRQQVRCREKGAAAAGSNTALCTVNDADLGQMMVMQGWAFAAEGSGRANFYKRAEMGAEATRAGLWKRRFVKPWEWRAGKRPAAD
jgi:endonuclease YncB( thermonuclease family)